VKHKIISQLLLWNPLTTHTRVHLQYRHQINNQHNAVNVYRRRSDLGRLSNIWRCDWQMWAWGWIRPNILSGWQHGACATPRYLQQVTTSLWITKHALRDIAFSPSHLQTSFQILNLRKTTAGKKFNLIAEWKYQWLDNGCHERPYRWSPTEPMPWMKDPVK